MKTNIIFSMAVILSLAGCNQTTSNSASVNKKDNKPPINVAISRPVVETKTIDGLTVTRHAMDEKRRFVIGISNSDRSQKERHFKIAVAVLNDVCSQFGPNLDRSNFKIGQVAHIVGQAGYLRPIYVSDTQTAYLYLWCNVITRTMRPSPH